MISDLLSREQQHALESLVSALDRDACGREASKIMAILDGFLLDDEQRQTLGLQPWNFYFLCAAACLSGGRDASRYEERLEMSGIIDRGQARILGLIGASIGGDPESGDTTLTVVEYKDQTINVPLISRAIRLAAELDLEHPDRVETIAAGMAGEDRIPAEQVAGRFRVTAVGPHPYAFGSDAPMQVSTGR